MKLYICGPMTGLPELNYPAFNEAERRLSPSYEIENPTVNEKDSNSSVPIWQQFMRLGLAQLVQCDGVALLPGWEDSRGAALEVFVATQLGIKIMPLPAWLQAEM